MQKLEDEKWAKARIILKNLLSKIPERHHQKFKQMYAKGNMEITIDKCVDDMDNNKIDWAMTQCETTILKQ